MIRYVSTRGEAPTRGFEEVLLAGLAEDGGLYVPQAWPVLPAPAWRELAALDYPALTARLLAPFTAGCFDQGELEGLARTAYGGFTHAGIAPLRQLERDLWLLELFHGPTLAFKDFAMQLLARMFEAVLQRRHEHLTIVGATSGDTGAAAVRAFAGMDRVRLAMLHPKGRISAVQRRQMTTEPASNILNIAVEGTFDDCQDLVKAMLRDPGLRAELRLSAVNSINWARVAAQAVYYVWAGLRLGAPHRRLAFTVPTGNFGNALAGQVAARLGLPIERLVVATNRNDILARFFESGTYARGEVSATQSPAMDIQVASNFERLLFALEGEDGARVRGRMQAFQQSGGFTVEEAKRGVALFAGGSADEAATTARIASVARATGEIVDPHTAVGLEVAARHAPPPGVPMVSLATAHPAKFPEAVEAACGRRPVLPSHLRDLMTRPERMVELPAEREAIVRHIRASFGPAR